jgi:hypothetical protein
MPVEHDVGSVLVEQIPPDAVSALCELGAGSTAVNSGWCQGAGRCDFRFRAGPEPGA